MLKEEVLEIINNDWLHDWDGSGWASIWKDYCEQVKKHIAEDMTDADFAKVNSISLDNKEKFGTLDIFPWPSSIDTFDEDISLSYIAEVKSKYTCIRCGAQPRNESGEHTIHMTSGWIQPYCSECLKKLEDSKSEVQTLTGNIFSVKMFRGNKSRVLSYKWNDDDSIKLMENHTN